MAPADKERLVNQLTDARSALDGTVAEWRRRLDVRARLRTHLALGITAGAAGGFVLGHWWPRRLSGGSRRAGRSRPHLVVSMLRTALTLGRPVLSAYFASLRSGSPFGPPSADSQTSDPSTP